MANEEDETVAMVIVIGMYAGGEEYLRSETIRKCGEDGNDDGEDDDNDGDDDHQVEGVRVEDENGDVGQPLLTHSIASDENENEKTNSSPHPNLHILAHL
ncbi:hypothetical protein CBOM_00742 [Ceraceosorus bombacis]|uniref:Uncharacterized protein n=1 Tax=Ceraceosorus bombacis TaxID=401625 RepID=A0A0P1B9V7_9BASI|nr:hypothetical protein CBOM_00742 [Ceraceosorus bombacis]